MLSTTYKIGNYEFEFTVGADHYCGIVIRNDNSNIDDPDYRECMKTAFEMLPILRAYHDITHWFGSNNIDEVGYQISRMPPEIIMELKNKCILVNTQKIIEFENGEESIVDMFLTMLKNPFLYGSIKSNGKVKIKPGYVYLIQSTIGVYKIGRTENPRQRMKALKYQFPSEELFCIALIETDDMIDLEKVLHEKFYNKCTSGEWFDLSPEDVEYIKGLQS